ncbi:hypothetical protein D1872_282860 [compost metagenome]
MLAQESNRTLYFFGEIKRFIDRLPVDIHEPRFLEQPVIVHRRDFNSVIAKIRQQLVDLILEKRRFP